MDDHDLPPQCIARDDLVLASAPVRPLAGIFWQEGKHRLDGSSHDSDEKILRFAFRRSGARKPYWPSVAFVGRNFAATEAEFLDVRAHLGTLNSEIYPISIIRASSTSKSASLRMFAGPVQRVMKRHLAATAQTACRPSRRPRFDLCRSCAWLEPPPRRRRHAADLVSAMVDRLVGAPSLALRSAAQPAG
jgi:hypothetical protein